MNFKNKRLSAQSMALAVLIGVGVSISAHADQAAAVDREIHLHPRFTERCRALDIVRVPSAWADFEAQIIEWIGTCVTSRSGDAQREVSLVRASKSISQLWQSLAKGKPARIVPNYTWGTFRVERIEFSSPQARATGSRTQRPPLGSTDPGGVPRPPTGYGSRGNGPTPTPGQQPAPSPKQKPPGFQPPAGVPHIAPQLPNEGDDLLFDARRLVEKLRADGQRQDADRLERKIKTAGKVLVSLALLAGTYYVGTKVRAGKILFLWGWNAMGSDYMRRAARLQQLVPEVENALRDVISTAKPHVPPAGSGIDWKVLDQLIDETLPAQLDDARARRYIRRSSPGSWAVASWSRCCATSIRTAAGSFSPRMATARCSTTRRPSKSSRRWGQKAPGSRRSCTGCRACCDWWTFPGSPATHILWCWIATASDCSTSCDGPPSVEGG